MPGVYLQSATWTPADHSIVVSHSTQMQEERRAIGQATELPAPPVPSLPQRPQETECPPASRYSELSQRPPATLTDPHHLHRGPQVILDFLELC